MVAKTVHNAIGRGVSFQRKSYESTTSTVKVNTLRGDQVINLIFEVGVYFIPFLLSLIILLYGYFEASNTNRTIGVLFFTIFFLLMGVSLAVEFSDMMFIATVVIRIVLVIGGMYFFYQAMGS